MISASNAVFISADVPALAAETLSSLGLMEATAAAEVLGPVGAAVSVAAILAAQMVQAGIQVFESISSFKSITAVNIN